MMVSPLWNLHPEITSFVHTHISTFRKGSIIHQGAQLFTRTFAVHKSVSPRAALAREQPTATVCSTAVESWRDGLTSCNRVNKYERNL